MTEAEFRCYGCQKPKPRDELTPVVGRGNRNPRLHCDGCKNQVRAAAGVSAGWNAQ